ncbi:MAG: trigger factor [Nitrospira sp.]|nr:trigger factor [Nitrospira sp.]
MKWEQHNNGDGYHCLSIEADWSELAADYDDIVASYAKVPVSGFRPGKVPRSVIEQRLQKEIIDDLTHRTVRRFGREAVREAGIEVLGPAEAEVIECAKGRAFRAAFRYHPMPKFTLPDLDSLKADAEDADPLDQISLRLLELVRFDIPDALVQEELALDGIDGAVPGSAEWEAASDRIRLMLILKQIAKQEGIEVDEPDVNRRIADKAKEFGTTPNALQAELARGGGMQRLRDMLLAESTLDYLLERNRHDV